MKKFGWLFMVIVLAFMGCSGRKLIMSESEINKLPEIKEQKGIKEYSVLWSNFNPVLLVSEGIGVWHNFYLEDQRIFSGVKVIGDDRKVRLMIIIIDSKPTDFNEVKGVILSRSGKHFYSVDGKNVFSKNGYLVPKFEWSKIEPLAKTGIEIWKNIEFGSEKDKKIQKILTAIGKGIDRQKIPGLFGKVMSRVAKITTQDVFFAGATDFTSLFAIFGVRVWAIVDMIIRKADLSLPYYDTALVDRFQLSLALEPIQKKINLLKSGPEIFPLVEEWTKEMREYRIRKMEYQSDHQKWLEEKAKYE